MQLAIFAQQLEELAAQLELLNLEQRWSDEELAGVEAANEALWALAAQLELEPAQDWATLEAWLYEERPLWRLSAAKILELHGGCFEAELVGACASFSRDDAEDGAALERRSRLAMGLLAVSSAASIEAYFKLCPPLLALRAIAAWFVDASPQVIARFREGCGAQGGQLVWDARSKLDAPDASAWAGAAVALGHLEDARHEEVALGCVHAWLELPESRWASRVALESLARRGGGLSEVCAQQVVELLRDAELAPLVVQVLSCCGERALPVLDAALSRWRVDDSCRLALAELVRAYGALGLAPADDALFALVREPDIYVRHLSWHQLVRRGYPALFEVLVPLAQSDDPVDRDEARHVLSMMDDPRVEGLLRAWIASCDDAWEREELEQWLADRLDGV